MWRMLFLGVAPAIASTVGLDGVLHTQYSNSLYAVNKDGSTKWIFDADASMGPYVEGLNNTVYATVMGKTNALFSLDGLDGSIKWKHQVDGNRRMNIRSGYDRNTLVVATDGTIYLTSVEYRAATHTSITTIDAIDTAGAVKWTFTKAGSGSLTDVGTDGTLFFLSGTSLDALRPDTGTLKWSTEVGGYYTTEVSTKDSNVFVLQRNHPHGVVSSLSNEDGSVLWNYNFSVRGRTFMTLSRNNEVYVSADMSDGTCGLRVFDFNGKALRNLETCVNDETTYDDEEDMFVKLSGRNVLAQSGTDGRLLWNASVPEVVNGAHFGQEGTVFVWRCGDSLDGQVHAIQNGKVIWSVQTGCGTVFYPPRGWSVHSSGVSKQLMVEDGTTFVDGWLCQKGHPGCVFGLDLVAIGADGMEKWRFTPTETVAELV